MLTIHCIPSSLWCRLLLPLMAVAWSIAVGASPLFAQNIQHTENKPDLALRSDSRVDPSTLGMSFSIPLTSYPGARVTACRWLSLTPRRFFVSTFRESTRRRLRALKRGRASSLLSTPPQAGRARSLRHASSSRAWASFTIGRVAPPARMYVSPDSPLSAITTSSASTFICRTARPTSCAWTTRFTLCLSSLSREHFRPWTVHECASSRMLERQACFICLTVRAICSARTTLVMN